jgi:hypothetical protein
MAGELFFQYLRSFWDGRTRTSPIPEAYGLLLLSFGDATGRLAAPSHRSLGAGV